MAARVIHPHTRLAALRQEALEEVTYSEVPSGLIASQEGARKPDRFG
jgi:hypothetical protein